SAVDGNEIWGNGLDGMRMGAPSLDASIVHNRIRNNGWRSEPAAKREGEGVTYEAFVVRDANARWPVNGHKGKTVLVAGQTAIVASNTEIQLSLFPHRPGAKSAWEKSLPQPGTLYVMQAAPAVRAGIAVAASITAAWIRRNRIWQRQARNTQTHEVWTGAETRECRVDDNGG